MIPFNQFEGSIAKLGPMSGLLFGSLLWTMIGNVELLSRARDNTVLQRSPRPAPGPGDHQPIRARDPGTWPIRSRARSHTSPSNGGYCNQPRYDILYGPRPQSLHYLTTSCDGKQVQEKCAAFTPLIQLDNEIEWERVLAESGAIWERERGDLVVSNSA